MEQHLMQNQQMASQRVGQLEAALAQQRAIVDQMTQTASNKRMFDDTVQGPYNQLNIPAVDGKRGADVDRVKHQARDCIKQYASNFSNFLTYMEEGLQQPGPPPVGSPAEHLVTALKGHSAYLKPLDRTFAAFADGSSDLADFLSSMKVLSMYVTSLAGIYRGCMDHQSAEATCTAALGAANAQTARDRRWDRDGVSDVTGSRLAAVGGRPILGGGRRRDHGDCRCAGAAERAPRPAVAELRAPAAAGRRKRRLDRRHQQGGPRQDGRRRRQASRAPARHPERARRRRPVLCPRGSRYRNRYRRAHCEHKRATEPGPKVYGHAALRPTRLGTIC